MRKLTGFPGTHPGSSTHVVVKMAGISEVDVEGVCHEYVAVGGQETPKLLAKGIYARKLLSISNWSTFCDPLQEFKLGRLIY